MEPEKSYTWGQCFTTAKTQSRQAWEREGLALPGRFGKTAWRRQPPGQMSGNGFDCLRGTSSHLSGDLPKSDGNRLVEWGK